MKAVILAAGRGERMMPLTAHTPKPLLHFKGKPLLDHIFEALPVEIDEVVLVVKYLGEKIKEYCGPFYRGRKITYAEGSEQGSAFSFLAARSFFKPNERFLIVYADEPLTISDVEECLKHQYAWLCYEVSDPKLSGIATITDDGFIAQVEEKPEHPKSNWAATGLLVVSADIFSYEPRANRDGEYYLTSLMNQFVKDHKVFAVKRGVSFKDRPQFTTPEDLLSQDRI